TGPSARKEVESIGGFFTQLKNIIGDLNEEIGFIFKQPLMDYFNPVKAVVLVLTDRLRGLSDETKSSIANWVLLGGAILGAVTVFGLLAMGIGLAMQGIGALFGVIALLMSPITLIILGIGLLATAWENDWGNIRTITKNAVDAIKGKWDELAAWWDETDLKKTIDNLWTELKKIWTDEELTFSKKVIETIKL
ncbi:MAG: hypothetical protein KGD67_12155, partial [Candidatus Lokiarchaeota archaeon]|nr:hypothetical protein [Candidatus Lokiarchaeota archaeon]